jgi:hypothetical protein
MLLVVEARAKMLEAPLKSPPTAARPDTLIDLEALPRDRSDFATLVSAIEPLLNHLSILDVVENTDNRDITFLAQELGKSAEEIMAAVVAARLEAALDVPAAAFYAFVRLRVPSTLPTPLLEASQDFTLIEALLRRIGSLICATAPDIQKRTLEMAVNQNLIGPQFASEITDIVQHLQEHRTRGILDQPYNVGKTTLSQLLDIAQLAKGKHELFAKALVDNTQSMRKFWKSLGDGEHGFTAAEASAVQRTLEIGAFVKNHPPIVEALLQGFSSGKYKSLPDLARLGEQDWIELVNKTGAPAHVDAAGEASPAEVFGRVVYTRVIRAYPTAALFSRVATASYVARAERGPLDQFFSNNPALELCKINLATYLNEHGDTAFTGILAKQRPAVIANAKRFQRVLRIEANADTAHTLLGLGIHSATQIATMGRQQFFNKATAAGLTKRDANRVYEAGAQRYGSLVSIFTKYNRDFIGTWPGAIGSVDDFDQPTSDAIQRDQSLATLFGSQDYCAVEGCTSVLSPAAYVCDLLLWLRNHPLNGPFATALAALLDRRPDIGHLLLNCPNTETPLPYIDLVNELLEDAVSPPIPPVWKQTNETAVELRAAPEHLNTAAYNILANASYPHTLPYDSPLDLLRTCLEQSGVHLWKLRQALLPIRNPSSAQQASVAAEYFGIAPHESDLICNANFVALTVAWNTANPVADLAPVPAFLRAASITYDQLLELIEVAWVRGGSAPMVLQAVGDTCDTSIQTLAPLDATRLDLIHRFLRLWRHSDWTMWELDLLLRAPLVGNGVLDTNALIALSTFRLLQRTTGLTVVEQLAFFQDLDLSSHRAPDGSETPSLFAKTFLDPAVPKDDDLTSILMGAAIADLNLSHHLPAIQAALEISASDATTLFGLTSGQLTLANLSLIYRVIALARTVNLSLVDLERVASLTAAGSIPAAFVTPATTLAFIRELKAVQQSETRFTMDALIYVLTTQPTATGITQDQITRAVLPSVRAAIQQINDEINASADPPLTILQRELAKLPAFADPALLDTAISIVNDTYAGTIAARNTFIAGNFGSFMDPATAQANLAPLPGGLTPAQLQAAIDLRAQQVLAPLATYLTQTGVIAVLAAGLQLQNDVCAFLVQQLTVSGTALTLLTALTDPALIAQAAGNYTPIGPATFPNQYLAIQLLDKVGTVVHRLHLVKADLSWLVTNAAVYGGLDLAQLPVLGTQPPLTITALLATSLLVKLDREFDAAPPAESMQDLYALIAGVAAGTIANEASAQAALATITGWPVSDIGSLATAIGVSFGGGDYTKPATYDALRTLEKLVGAFGKQKVSQEENLASGAQIVNWGVAAPDDTAATSALGVLKARYSNVDWLKVAPTMMNPIRERRSAALQAFLLAQRDGAGNLVYGDTNAIFDHFLIDVQMSSCEVTTRVIQAYAAIQLFVERCLMSLEEPNVVVDLTKDDTWSQWFWMKRYRIWEANRKIFLYPENWLIESQRPNRTEIFKKLEQEVHQNDSTRDFLETVSLNYIDRLDEIAHLQVTGTCSDPVTHAIHVIARTLAEPPRFYHRVRAEDGAWSGWEQIPLDIKAHQVVPAVYRRRLCLFWPDVKVSNEPRQNLPAVQPSATPPSQEVARYVSIGLDFSVFRNGTWAPAQKSKGKLFDIPLLGSDAVSDNKSVEALYTLKVQTRAVAPGYGATLAIDVFRLGAYDVFSVPIPTFDSSSNIISWDNIRFPSGIDQTVGVQIGRAIFDGRFSDLELRNLPATINRVAAQPDFSFDPADARLLTHAQTTYGPDAQPLLLLPDTQAEPNLTGELGMLPRAGALTTLPGLSSPFPLVFSPDSPLDIIGAWPLLWTASAPFRVIGPATNPGFDPTSYFFYQDNRRCYFVESARYYQWGSAWLPLAPSDPAGVPFEVRYHFHRFYHPYTRLLWHQLSAGSFPSFYNRDLQLSPDSIDPSGADVFSFLNTYNPIPLRVDWSQGENLSEDKNKEIIDFSADAAYSVYNWELFFHTPLYIAERLSQNQQFENALAWFHFIFNPTRQGPEPVPQRFWIPKPLNNLTTPQILKQRINELLLLVNQGDPTAVAEVTRWRRNPFNPFLIADQRPVAYMKRVLMSYLDNLIAWADNLYSTDSREALNEATLLYVIAAEILGPQPVAITPPKHADACYDDLELKLDVFANALVDIENLIGAGGSGGAGGGAGAGGGLPMAQTFYFKIPPNDKLLGYWKTVANRLFKLRHCQNIAGVERQLALFDAPIDPGLLIKAQAAGVDIGSVLSDVTAPLPNYRFTALYPQALDFVNAVRAYGTSLLGAIEKSDSAALSILQQTTAQQLLKDGDQILQWQVDAAQSKIEELNNAYDLVHSKYEFNSSQEFMNADESTVLNMGAFMNTLNYAAAVMELVAACLNEVPTFCVGASGFGASPVATALAGGTSAADSAGMAAAAEKTLMTALDTTAKLVAQHGSYERRRDTWRQNAAEATIGMAQVDAQLAGARLALQIAQWNQVTHQEQIDNAQQQIDFLTNKFTSQELYDWMVGQLADTYFQSYRLAYSLCKRVERCYRYELGIPDSSFIQFGYWDSLRKGLLAGESLNHDLRRMQASYLEQNSRRFEMSRFISLAALDPSALVALLQKGLCDFDLPEPLFDNDYPGHYQRRLARASLTVVYSNPGKFDNVKCTLTLVKNSVRVSTDLGSGYPRQAGNDPRFVDQYAAVPQKIVLGNGQDDPGLFLTSISSNLGDQRYVPFEGAGAISSWHLELPAETNEIDLTAVGDVVIHLYYTALDGGDAFKQAVQEDNTQNLPTQGAKLFSALSDFLAPSPDPAPAPAEGPTQTPWQSFLATPAPGSDQQLVLSISPSKFPSWTRGKTITVTGLTVFVLSWNGGSWVLQPQAPLPTGNINLQPVANAPTVAAGIVAMPASTSVGKWTFKLRKSTAADFRSLGRNDLGDVVLLVNFQVN